VVSISALNIACRYLISALSTAICFLSLANLASGGEIQIQAVENFDHLSLLEDGHHDEILSVDGPSGSSINSYMMVLSDGKFLVPLERLEAEDEGNQNDRYFLFDQEVHGDCTHSDAKFFRKIVGGKVAGFYAIRWAVWLGEVDPDKVDGYDDFRNSIIVYEIFRFERPAVAPDINYPRFRKVAEKRIVVQDCEQAKIGDEVIQMIRDY
jgi:hypothetical protein